MHAPQNLRYTKSHEWVDAKDDGTASIGLTDYAQASLGDLVFVNLPEVDSSLQAGDVLCDVESVKAVSDVYMPVSGAIAEVNEELDAAPERINESPYEAWICVVKDVDGLSELMSAADYEAYVATLDE